jgi:hypothetical protein
MLNYFNYYFLTESHNWWFKQLVQLWFASCRYDPTLLYTPDHVKMVKALILSPPPKKMSEDT